MSETLTPCGVCGIRRVCASPTAPPSLILKKRIDLTQVVINPANPANPAAAIIGSAKPGRGDAANRASDPIDLRPPDNVSGRCLGCRATANRRMNDPLAHDSRPVTSALERQQPRSYRTHAVLGPMLGHRGVTSQRRCSGATRLSDDHRRPAGSRSPMLPDHQSPTEPVMGPGGGKNTELVIGTTPPAPRRAAFRPVRLVRF